MENAVGRTYPALEYTEEMGGDFEKGVWIIECGSYREFEDSIKKFKKLKKYIWRGQRHEKTLKPTIYRDFTPNDETIRQHLYQFRKDMPWKDDLEQFLELIKKERSPEFEKALSKYYNMIHPKADKDDPKENYEEDFINDIYWAIGQHHGLKTPLLDWTKDPYKALFFAFCERKEKHDKRVIFCLAEKSRLLLEKKQPTKRYIEFLKNLDFVKTLLESSNSPTDAKEVVGQMFGRIEAQEGQFTRTLYNEDIEEHIKKYYWKYKNKYNVEIVFLAKIRIPDSIREIFLEKLEEKEITYKKMYPDLLGTVSYCNLKLEQQSRTS